jgi:hypothetical protein
MSRFNLQIAKLVEDQDLCQSVHSNFQLGYSIRYIANKYQISRYAVIRIAKYWQEKENRTEEVR